MDTAFCEEIPEGVVFAAAHSYKQPLSYYFSATGAASDVEP